MRHLRGVIFQPQVDDAKKILMAKFHHLGMNTLRETDILSV